MLNGSATRLHQFLYKKRITTFLLYGFLCYQLSIFCLFHSIQIFFNWFHDEYGSNVLYYYKSLYISVFIFSNFAFSSSFQNTFFRKGLPLAEYVWVLALTIEIVLQVNYFCVTYVRIEVQNVVVRLQIDLQEDDVGFYNFDLLCTMLRFWPISEPTAQLVDTVLVCCVQLIESLRSSLSTFQLTANFELFPWLGSKRYTQLFQTCVIYRLRRGSRDSRFPTQSTFSRRHWEYSVF